MTIRRALLTAPFLLLLACTDDGDVDDDRVVQTGVVVDPAEFLGDLPCAEIDGAPKSYVATVVDVTGGVLGEAIGTSNPVSCGTPVAFHNIRGGRVYGAQVSVFDVPADQAATATPAWTSTCGLDGAGAAEIVAGRQTRIRGCTAINGAGTATTSIVVDATGAVGALGCAAEDGEIGDITIVSTEPADAALPAVTIACGQPAVVYSTAIEPGTLYAFQLEAEGSDGQIFGAKCTAVARDGLGVPASCTLLLETGSLEFPIPAVVEDAGLACGDAISRAVVSAFGADVSVGSVAVPCDAPAFASSLPPGTYSGTVGLYAGPDLVRSFACAGEVVPGTTTPLTCIAN